MIIKCIFCEWEGSTREEKDNCKWKPCDKCRIKCGIEQQIEDKQ
jgi:hypothetical protein